MFRNSLVPDSNFYPDPDSMNTDPKHGCLWPVFRSLSEGLALGLNRVEDGGGHQQDTVRDVEDVGAKQHNNNNSNNSNHNTKPGKGNRPDIEISPPDDDDDDDDDDSPPPWLVPQVNRR